MSHHLVTLIAGVLNTSPENLTLESGPLTVPGWDSLAHVTIVAAIEQTYGIELTMPEILSIRTVGDLVQTLERHGIAASDGSRTS